MLIYCYHQHTPNTRYMERLTTNWLHVLIIKQIVIQSSITSYVLRAEFILFR